MSLTLPSTDDLYNFWGDEAPDEDDDRATLLIQLGADLLWMATGLDEDPTDPRLQRLVGLAILDMAIYLYITRDDVDANYSPFQSERVGSYSYSKTYSRMSRSIAVNDSTGATLFDNVVAYLATDALSAGGGWATSTNLHPEPYIPLREAAYAEFGVFLADYIPGRQFGPDGY